MSRSPSRPIRRASRRRASATIARRGSTRASIGVQSFDDAALKALAAAGCTMPPRRATPSMSAAQVFERYSFDLIYARAEPDRERLGGGAEDGAQPQCANISRCISSPSSRTRCSSGCANAGKLVVPDSDLGRAFWDVTQELTALQSLPAYEVSNHARRGSESRHNLIYLALWRICRRRSRRAWPHPHAPGAPRQSTERHPEMWLTVVEADGQALIEDELPHE